jgi:hypothetical protein
LPLLLAVLGVAVAGCRLIDQRTFEPAGVAPTAGELGRSGALAGGVAAGRPPRPLVTVMPGDLEHDWKPDVLAAVRDALARDPNAAFDIVTPYPTRLGQAARDRAVATGAADAAAVAGVIEADGVAADRLHLGARGDAGQPAREVMILPR